MREISELEIRAIISRDEVLDVSLFEKEFNLVLPDDFKMFVLESCGGYPELNTFFSDYGEFSVGCFFYLTSEKQGDSYNLWKEISEFRLASKKEGVVPFAEDGGGNIFFLQQPIYDVWYFVRSTDQVIYLCGSFGDFIDGLEYFDEM